MNRNRRRTLYEALNLLRTASSVVSGVLNEEEDCLGSLPENLERGEQYGKTERAVEALSMAAESIEAAIGGIEEAIG